MHRIQPRVHLWQPLLVAPWVGLVACAARADANRRANGRMMA